MLNVFRAKISQKFWARLLRVHSAGNLREPGRTIAESGKPSSTAWHENKG